MKKFTYYLTILLIFITTACNKTDVTQTVKFSGVCKSKYKTKMMMSHDVGANELKELNVPITYDKNGAFSVEFVLNKPTYFTFNTNTIYLCPGDSLNVTIEQDAQKSTFRGTRTVENTYLRNNYFFVASSYFQRSNKQITDRDSLLVFVKEKSTERLNDLNKLSGVSKEFRTTEKARINADIVNTLTSSISFNKDLFKTNDYDEYYRLQEKYTKPISDDIAKAFEELNSGDYLNLDVVQWIIYSISKNKALNTKIALNKTYQEYADYLKFNAELLKITPNKVEAAKTKIETFSNKNLKKVLQETFNSATQLLSGSPAIDIELEDINGKKVNLSDYKGKTIYLDFWATWCGPCKQEAPYFEKLMKEMGNDEIVFISVSVDKKKDDWKSYLAKHDKKTIQLHSLDPKIKSKWQEYSIPRFILIDKDFKIIDAHAPRPSSKEAKEMLSNLK